MTRQQVVRRQTLVAIGIVVAILTVLGVRAYRNTFAHQIKLGKLVEATLAASDGALPTWKDPALLAEIEAALPRYKAGPGYAATEDSHETIVLVLADDKRRQVALELPQGDSPLVTIGPRAEAPAGNSWPAPRLLAILAKHGLPVLKAKQASSSVLEAVLESWQKDFGDG
jgi:hypothetical protein